MRLINSERLYFENIIFQVFAAVLVNPKDPITLKSSIGFIIKDLILRIRLLAFPGPIILAMDSSS